MEHKEDYIKDISEIRSMMVRTTRFLSLSGWAGIMAGIYAIIGAYIADNMLDFKPNTVIYQYQGDLCRVIILAIIVLILAICTAIYLSGRKAAKTKEKLWNATTRRLLINMCVPLVSGGLFILVLILKELIGLIGPMTMIFYGLSLYIASKYTFDDIKILGLLQISLGLAASYFIDYSLILWALGFGICHIIYGIYVHYKYEK